MLALARRFVRSSIPVTIIGTSSPLLAAGLTLAQRIDAQRAIEQVYWQHRTWPAQNPGPKPALAAILPEAVVAARAEDAMRLSAALNLVWSRPVTHEQLQAELDRIARESRGQDSSYNALGTGGRYDPATDSWQTVATKSAPTPRKYHTAVWTGTVMIVWGGYASSVTNSGGRYNPSTDAWLPVSTTGVPSSRQNHTAIWTGSAMVVWGGWDAFGSSRLNTGGRYTPSTNSWTATSTGTNCPSGRSYHTAVWTGSEMIVWGGLSTGSGPVLSDGGRYNPATDAWDTPPSTANVPTARYQHSAVWTGTLVIVWGGQGYSSTSKTDTGGRYDPSADTWQPTFVDENLPAPRYEHSAVWTGSEMIVWGGYGNGRLNSGSRYSPVTNS